MDSLPQKNDGGISDNRKKMVADNGRKETEKMVAQKSQTIYNPKNDVECIDDTNEVKENMVADNSQIKKENMEDRKNDQVKLVATNCSRKESQIDKSMPSE